MTEQKERNIPAWKSPFVIGWFAILAVVLMVNVFMISLAFSGFSGLVIEDFYEKGKNYGTTIEKNKRMDEMGWDLKVDLQNLKKDVAHESFITLKDKTGTPIDGAKVTLFIYRPSNKAYDFSVEYKPVGAGVYQAQVSFPIKGIWDTIAVAEKGDDVFEIGRRVYVGMLNE